MSFKLSNKQRKLICRYQTENIDLIQLRIVQTIGKTLLKSLVITSEIIGDVENVYIIFPVIYAGSDNS